MNGFQTAWRERVSDPTHRRKFLTAVRHQAPWWIALGTETPEGVTVRGIERPWTSSAERTAWLQWSHGSGDARACRALLDSFREVPAWLYNITQAFYSAHAFHGSVDDWENPVILPDLARLRWVPQWVWDPVGKRWTSPDGSLSIRVIPGFAPWADLMPGRPYSVAAWYRQDESVHALSALSGPWLIAALLQSLWLQGVHGGYWDIATSDDGS